MAGEATAAAAKGKLGTALKVIGIGVLVCAFGGAAAAIPAGQMSAGTVLTGGAKALGHWGASAVTHTGNFVASAGNFAQTRMPV